MAYKRITAMEIYEIIRRWHSGQKNTQISAALQLDRKTVRTYIKRAQETGLSKETSLPEKSELLAILATLVPKKPHHRPVRTVFDPFKDEIIGLVTAKVDPVKPKTAFEIITERYAIDPSYSSFKRFVRSIPELNTPRKTTCRFETEPAEEIQIDYGKMGRLTDPLTGKNRDVFAFIAACSHSRFKYVEFCYKQDQRSFISSHLKMFEYFGGVPKRLIIDNLKAGIVKPDLYEPKLNRAYQEMAEHYRVFIDPARPYHPKDKGKIERTVPVVREQFRKMKSLNEGMDISGANRQIRTWALDIDGNRIHGTTGLRPREVFDEIEKPALAPLPIEHLEEFDFSLAPQLNRTLIRELATCNFICQGEGIILTGSPGTGKTHLAKAIGHHACRKNYSVIFYKFHQLFADLTKADFTGTLEKLFKILILCDLLIIDDFAFKKIDQQNSEFLYNIVDARYGAKSIILTSNRAMSEGNPLEKNSPKKIKVLLVKKSKIT